MTGALAKAASVKDKATEIMGMLGMSSAAPAAAAAAAPAKP